MKFDEMLELTDLFEYSGATPSVALFTLGD